MQPIFSNGVLATYRHDLPVASVLGQMERRAIADAMAPASRWYGVSSGDGNDGVSRMFPDYYVWTNDPWELARQAAMSELNEDVHDEIEVDGESDYGVSAVVHDDLGDDGEPIDLGYAAYILEVFPVDLEDVQAAKADPWGRPCYDSLIATFAA